jgi:hypothetical protein
MAAIALAESGGNDQAANTTPPDASYGLWQINYYGPLYPSRVLAYGTPQQLLASPQRQAAAAVNIAAGGAGLHAWSTYSSGAYLRYLSGLPSTVPAASTPAAAPAAADATTTAAPAISGPMTDGDIISAIATYGPGVLDQDALTSGTDPQLASSGSSIWGGIKQGFIDLSPALWFAQQGKGAVDDLEGVAKAIATGASDVAVGVGVLVWLTKPVNLLRVAEVATGAVLMAMAGAFYVAVLIPGIGGVVGTLAGGPVKVAGAAAKTVGGVERATSSISRSRARSSATRARSAATRTRAAATREVAATRAAGRTERASMTEAARSAKHMGRTVGAGRSVSASDVGEDYF